MKPPDPSFADEFNVPQEYTVLVFDVRQAVASLPFQIRRLEMLVEAGLVAFSSACLEFADEVPEEAQHGSLANLPEIFPATFTAFQGLLLWGSARRCLLASSLCCQAAFISASTSKTRASTLCSARVLRARHQFSRSGKHGVRHAVGDVTDAGTIGDWW